MADKQEISDKENGAENAIVEEILASAGDHYDGGSPESRADIATEWVDAFGDVDEPSTIIGIMVDAGYWDAKVAREVYDHVNDPSFFLADQIEELHDKISPIWEPEDVDGMDVVYALCNRDADLDKLVEMADDDEVYEMGATYKVVRYACDGVDAHGLMDGDAYDYVFTSREEAQEWIEENGGVCENSEGLYDTDPDHPGDYGYTIERIEE